MSEYTTQDAIKSAMQGNVADFKSAVNDLLTQKVQDALELKRMEVASSFMSAEVEEDDFGEEEYEIDTEGETDGDQEI